MVEQRDADRRGLKSSSSRRRSSSGLIGDSVRTLDAAMERTRRRAFGDDFRASNDMEDVMNGVLRDDDDDDDSTVNAEDCDEEDRVMILELAHARREQRQRQEWANDRSQESRPIRRLPTRTSTIRPPRSSSIFLTPRDALPRPDGQEGASSRPFAPSPEPLAADFPLTYIVNSVDGSRHPLLAEHLPAEPEAERDAGSNPLDLNRFAQPVPLTAGGPGERTRNFARRGGAAARGGLSRGRTGRSQPTVAISSEADRQRDEFERSAIARRMGARRAVEREEEDRREISIPIAGTSGASLSTILDVRIRSDITDALNGLQRWLSGMSHDLNGQITADLVRSPEARRVTQLNFAQMDMIIGNLGAISSTLLLGSASIQPQLARFLATFGEAVTTFTSTLPCDPEVRTPRSGNRTSTHYEIPDWQAMIPPCDDILGAPAHPSTSGSSVNTLGRSNDTMDAPLGTNSPLVTLTAPSHESTPNPTSGTTAAHDNDDLASQATSLLESARQARDSVMALIDDSRDLVEDGRS